tara:strand:- start:2991 stop:3608 length:618 start_codon:yes stop_codon:yes gene_type:complete
MPKAKLVTRSGTTANSTENIPKNSGLTNAELDGNFIGVRDQGFRIRADDSTQHTVNADTQVNFPNATITVDANGDLEISVPTTSTSASIFTSLQVSTTGASGTDIGNLMRVNKSQIDFNHQGSVDSTATFCVFGNDAQQATGNRPLCINLDGVHEGCEVGLAPYNSGSLPTTHTPGLLIAISNNGHKPAYYDGSNWRYVSDNSTV